MKTQLKSSPTSSITVGTVSEARIEYPLHATGITSIAAKSASRLALCCWIHRLVSSYIRLAADLTSHCRRPHIRGLWRCLRHCGPRVAIARRRDSSKSVGSGRIHRDPDRHGDHHARSAPIAITRLSENSPYMACRMGLSDTFVPFLIICSSA